MHPFVLKPASCAVMLVFVLATALAGCDSSGPHRASAPTPAPGSTGGGGSNGGGGLPGGNTPPVTLPVTVPGGVPGTGGGGGGSPANTNSAPVALADVAIVQINSTGNPLNVLANDSDANGDALSLTRAVFTASAPPTAGGTVTVAADGKTLRYTPPVGFVGVQTISYTITDGKGGTASALAVVTASPLAIPPVAVPDVFTLVTDGPVTTLNVTANDVDGAGGGLVVTAASSVLSVPPGNGGTISIVNGSLCYQPKAGFTGVDNLIYTVRDANGATATATVTLTVLPLAVPPVALPDVSNLAAGATADIDVLANDVDLAGGGLTLVTVGATASVPPGSNGGFSIVNNRVRYAPPSAGFVGVQLATYTVSDANGQTATGLITLTITIGLPPLPPVAVPDVATVVGGNTLATLAVLGNDIDAAGGGLRITAASVAAALPPDAAVTVTTDGSTLRLALPSGYAGVVTLSYTIIDSNGSTSTTAVIVTVTPAALPAVPPVLLPDVVTIAQDSSAININVLANDVDAAGGGLTLTAASVTTSLPAGAHTVAVAGNQVRFTPAAGFAGVVVLGYSARDANGSVSTTGAVTITVSPLPAVVPPVALPDVATVASSAGAASINVLTNDIDTAGGGLSLTSATLTGSLPMGAGTIAVVGNAVRYTPAAGYAGLVSVSYTVTDSKARTATGVLTITVLP